MIRKEKTLADFTAIAISPVLIMALVGSLVFFLLEILYQGKHEDSLRWILFCFVFGAVLIARISMESGISDRAAAYGFALGLVVWLALVRYVEYPSEGPMASWGWAINLGLIAIIWWSAHRLTWDCTLIDDQVDASGAGLLEVAGLEKNSAAQPAAVKDEAKAKKKQKEPAGLAGWDFRYQRYREEKKKRPQAPGVWVVYFSLAALPLFGLGQAQIPVEETSRRAYAFRLLCIYVGSGLGLLLTTSFLGLRRYLRQRKLQMPAAVTSAWLTLGVLLIGALMLLGAVLPRPADTNPLWRWTGLTGKEQDPSRWGLVGKGKEDKDGTRPSTKKADKDDPEAGKKAGKDGKPNGEKKDDKKNGSGKEQGNGPSSGQKKGGEKQADKSGNEGEKKESQRNPDTQKPENSPQQSSFWQDLFNFLAKLLRWLVLIAVVILVVYFVVRGLLQFLAHFTHWARNLLAAWNRLLAWLQKQGSPAEEQTAEADMGAPPRPFASFADPFVSGVAGRLTGKELVRYSFEALEAWARERDCGRNMGETPIEFAQRVGDEAPALEEDARRLAQLYAGLAYARANLTGEGRETLRVFWEMLTEVSVRPLSAAGRVG